ncbi:unnamed protein product [Paramecium sonneborni]|uniref:Transmembrane protein n=1 Tax=Paramecium sonneborni TaxID=65129 RepID=A0A8S1Q0F1_9CILI|nr:unnamed protein product [Paramecium sonneborni]
MIRTKYLSFQEYSESNLNHLSFSFNILSLYINNLNPQLVSINQLKLSLIQELSIYLYFLIYIQAFSIPIFQFFDLKILVFQGSLFEPLKFYTQYQCFTIFILRIDFNDYYNCFHTKKKKNGRIIDQIYIHFSVKYNICCFEVFILIFIVYQIMYYQYYTQLRVK